MSLDLVEGSTHFGKTITWYREDDTLVDLTNATVTGRMKQMISGVATTGRAVDGTLTPQSPYTTGIFTWAPGATDVGTPGTFIVQFIATYPDTKPEVSKPHTMKVYEAI